MSIKCKNKISTTFRLKIVGRERLSFLGFSGCLWHTLWSSENPRFLPRLDCLRCTFFIFVCWTRLYNKPGYELCHWNMTFMCHLLVHVHICWFMCTFVGSHLCILLNTFMFILYVLASFTHIGLSALSFCLFSISVSMDILMLILDIGEWGCHSISFLAPTQPMKPFKKELNDWRYDHFRKCNGWAILLMHISFFFFKFSK